MIWAPGLEVTIDNQGKGRFIKKSTGEKGRFLLTATQFYELVVRMEVFRRAPDAVSGEDIAAYLASGDQCRDSYVTDSGGISFQWIGPSVNDFYSVDYGCDRERYASRNKELQAILKSLPVPEPDGLP